MSPEELAKVIAAFALMGMVFMFPLITVLLRHQRQMTELMRHREPDLLQQRIQALELEVQQLMLRQDQSAVSTRPMNGEAEVSALNANLG